MRSCSLRVVAFALICGGVLFVGVRAEADNVASIGTAIMGIADDIAGSGAFPHVNGNFLTEINDGISGTPGDAVVINGDGSDAANGNGIDTWAGGVPEVGKEFDYVGITWDNPINDVTQVTIQHFLPNDGGWWGPADTVVSDGTTPISAAEVAAPALQVTTDGTTWTDVATTNDYVAAITGDLRGTGFPSAVVSDVATFDFAEQDGLLGIRLIGNGAGNAGTDSNGFLSTIEFTVEGTIPEPSTLALTVLLISGALCVRRCN